ncbi:hypothetical protein ACFQUU_29000 [Herbaspirillum sp. GCM10030257]|uniref:hypothetical protein n=1 Tax=Herbaspirillum sp. GCM10030257 TaxID=3273393 RepID=UPI00361DEA5C
MKLLRKVLWYGFVSIPMMLLLAVLFWKQLVGFLLHDLPFMGETFNKARWENALRCSSNTQCMEVEMACVRGPMYRDLKGNYLSDGTTKEDVLRLLGSAKPDHQNPSCMVYELGMCSGFKMDYDYLHICFDMSDKIKGVRHYQG